MRLKKNKTSGGLFNPEDNGRKNSGSHHGSVQPKRGIKMRKTQNMMQQEMSVPRMIFTTIGEIQNYPEFVLAQTDQDIAFIKEYVGKDAKDFDGFFVKQKDGEITELYGFQGSVPDIRKTLTKIMTPEERIKSLGSRGRERVK